MLGFARWTCNSASSRSLSVPLLAAASVEADPASRTLLRSDETAQREINGGVPDPADDQGHAGEHRPEPVRSAGDPARARVGAGARANDATVRQHPSRLSDRDVLVLEGHA